MGKKKSLVLMVLLTIVIVVLCAITVVPSFTIPGTGKVKVWNPVVKQFDLGADLGGGYYSYYYPEGIISETEYKNLKTAAEAEGADAVAELAKSYTQHKGLYLKNDPELGVVVKDGDTYTVSKEFEEDFAEVTEEIVSRYQKKGYTDYAVTIVDDYALRVQIPASEVTEQNSAFQNAYNTFGLFAETGALELKKGENLVEERNEYEVNEIIKSFSVKKKYDAAWIKIKFTDVGKSMVEAYREGSSTDKLALYLGENKILEINATEHVTTRNTVEYPIANLSELSYVETMVILLNSSLTHGAFDVEFSEINNSQVRQANPVYGDNTMTLLLIAMAVIIVALIVFSIVKMGGFGVAGAYSIVSYLIVVAMFYAFVSGGVFEITLGSALIFALVLAIMTVMNMQVYGAIKTEFSLGKTVVSSVKSGYKKTILNVVDVYAVMLLGALALLVGTGGLNVFAIQAIICIVTGAFCNLLWTRVINVMLLSASKNKYKYFRFVREDDDDE